MLCKRCWNSTPEPWNAEKSMKRYHFCFKKVAFLRKYGFLESRASKSIKKRQSRATCGNISNRNRASVKTFSRLSFPMISGGSKSQDFMDPHEMLPFVIENIMFL